MKTKHYILALILLSILFFQCNDTENTKNTNNKNNTELIANAIINPPLPVADIKYDEYEVAPDSDTLIVYRTGTLLRIPENAFLDKDGNVIKTPVKIKYREFSNMLEIYLAGIPMEYDSAETSFVFETAGMIDFNASSENLPVFPNPKSKISVNMVSYNNSTDMNLYSLDTATGKWAYLGKDKISTKNYEEELEKLPNIPPIPKKAGYYSFSVEDGTGDFPELSMYENILFEPVDNKRCGFSSTEIKVKALRNGKYEIIFVMDAYGVRREQKCICYLAFKAGVDYDNAMKKYQNKYKYLIKKRDKQKALLEKEWDTYFAIRKQYSDAGLLGFFMKKEVEKMDSNDKIIRAFELNGFGIKNIDFPTIMMANSELIATYTNEDGDKIKMKNMVLAIKSKNIFYRIEDEIKFSTKDQNMMWGFTSDNKLAWFSTEDFKRVRSRKGTYTFKMRIHHEKINTYEDVMKVLF